MISKQHAPVGLQTADNLGGSGQCQPRYNMISKQHEPVGLQTADNLGVQVGAKGAGNQPLNDALHLYRQADSQHHKVRRKKLIQKKSLRTTKTGMVLLERK